MRALLDTHTVLSWFADDPSLSSSARRLITSSHNDIFVSAVSAWEIAVKVRLGKLPGAEELASDFPGYLDRCGFEPLPITIEHAVRAGLLPGPHRDPFDRMLVAQSQSEDLSIASNDTVFDLYGVRRIW